MLPSLGWWHGQSSADLATLRDELNPLVPRLGGNLSGQYKRGIGMAVHIGIGNFSGAIASNIYRTRDAPRFALGRKAHIRRSYDHIC